MASMMKRHFQRGSGCFKCENCGRNTRDTGVQSMSCRLCPECYEAAGIENQMSDEGETPELLAELESLRAAAIAKGGSLPELDRWWGR